ncbi:MAG: hypothetical protein KDK89_06090 [Alphaproteobacteria bacterium]|nr:hypothetical protein [Alphaproteobacteria bacterium]
MKVSLATSLFLHAAILVAALVVLPDPNPYKIKPQEAVLVDISNIGEVSKRMAMATDANPKTEPPAPKKTEAVKKADPTAKVAEEVKKAAKEPKAEPPPEPKKDPPKKEEVKTEPPKKEEPKSLAPDPLKDLIKETVNDDPTPPKKEEPKKQETKKAEVKPKEKPKAKPEKKKPQKLDVNELEAFLNKIDGETTTTAEASDKAGSPAKGEANLQGTDNQLSATIIEALVQSIRKCWSVPAGAREANVIVKVRFGLDLDGSVIGVPQIMNGTSDPLFQATARSAVAAILECQTYGFLPQDQYDLWKDLIINFNPNMMFDS